MTIQNTTTIICSALLALLTPTISHANFAGSDDFNDNSKNTSLWGTDVAVGGGLMAETNQHLQFTATGATANDAAGRPWIANTGSYTSDWSVQMDVNVPTVARSLVAGQQYAFTLNIRNSAAVNFNTSFAVDLQYGNFGGTLDRGFNSHQDLNGIEASDVSSATVSTSAAIRVRYNAATTTLISEFDANGAIGGYSFTPFDSQNISAWGMTASSTFQATPIGYTTGNLTIASSDNVFADNFLAVPEPSACLLVISGLGFMALKRSRRIRA